MRVVVGFVFVLLAVAVSAVLALDVVLAAVLGSGGGLSLLCFCITEFGLGVPVEVVDDVAVVPVEAVVVSVTCLLDLPPPSLLACADLVC